VAERRKSERVPVHEAVLVELAAAELRLTSIGDLSEGGAFIERVTATIGQRVVVYLTGGEADWSAPLHAVVRWTSSDGAGVEFRDLPTRGTSAIAAALVRGRRPSHARQRTAMRSIKPG
jgi:hypothetical protein